MNDSLASQRLAENEVVFRQSNEQVQRKLKDLHAKAKEEDYPSLLVEENPSLYFYCECSDEKCRERIVMKSDKYRELHKDRKQFIIMPGHQVVAIEKVIMTKPSYTVVKKLIATPKKANRLNKTDVDNG